jgi:hypothetical protein
MTPHAFIQAGATCRVHRQRAGRSVDSRVDRVDRRSLNEAIRGALRTDATWLAMDATPLQDLPTLLICHQRLPSNHDSAASCADCNLQNHCH